MRNYYNYTNRPVRRISPKWHSAIWALLVVASLFRNVSGIASDVVTSIPKGAVEVIVNVFVDVLFTGALPALLCFLCASVLFSMSARRGYLYCHRDDFIYIVMIFTAGARLVIGIVECFSFVQPVVAIYTSFTADVLVLTAAMFAMYFAVLKPRFMNDRTASDLFNLYGGIYFLVQGLFTIVPCATYLSVYGDSARSAELREILSGLGYEFTVAESAHFRSACIAGLVIFGIMLVAYIVLAILLREKAKKYVPPAEPPKNDNPFGGNDGNPFDDNGGNGGGNTFGGDAPSDGGGNGKVFEEFDL